MTLLVSPLFGPRQAVPLVEPALAGEREVDDRTVNRRVNPHVLSPLDHLTNIIAIGNSHILRRQSVQFRPSLRYLTGLCRPVAAAPSRACQSVAPQLGTAAA